MPKAFFRDFINEAKAKHHQVLFQEAVSFSAALLILREEVGRSKDLARLLEVAGAGAHTASRPATGAQS
jgi:hypothetical protein